MAAMNILIVDDHQTNLTLFTVLVKKLEGVTSVLFSDPSAALAWCEMNEPDLLLLDYMMPGIDGLQFIQMFRNLPGKDMIPVVMITADIERDIRYQALELGANDFLTKPVDKIEFLVRVKNMLALRKGQLELANRASWLAVEVQKATEEIRSREQEIVYRLSRAAEYRDPETGAHIQRMSHYSHLIALHLGLPGSEQILILESSPMHDLGKLGTPDQILLKRGPLNEEEMAIMREHTTIGAKVLEGSTSPLLQAARLIALTHHEKYDGSGYPQGLKGEDIPLYGRICAVADVFDALTSQRPYKEAWDFDRAADLLRECKGSHFDPQCVDAFFSGWSAVLDINRKFHD